MSAARGHQLMVPNEVWEWAQRESSLTNPGPWLRERLAGLSTREEAAAVAPTGEPPLFDMPVALRPVPSAGEEETAATWEHGPVERDWSHPSAPRDVGRFYRKSWFPTSCIDCGMRLPEGTAIYKSHTRTGIEQERCWHHGELYKNYWWPTVGGPHLQEGQA